MHLKAFYSIPKSTSKKKSEDMKRWIIRPIKKPDLDNVCKIIADALNGIVYKDDTQIVKIIAEKYYAETPCVEVSIKEAI
jgi:Holliday junction resolvase RusA-like endonuclease